MAVFVDDQPAPRGRNALARCRLAIGVALALDGAEEIEGIQDGATAGCRLKLDMSQDRGQKPSDPLIAVNEFLLVVVVGRTCQGIDGRDGAA